jgi:hypothetical protein
MEELRVIRRAAKDSILQLAHHPRRVPSATAVLLIARLQPSSYLKRNAALDGSGRTSDRRAGRSRFCSSIVSNNI